MRQSWHQNGAIAPVSIAALLAVTAPAFAITPSRGLQTLAYTSALGDRRSITFEAAITIEAMQRSNDVAVRSLRAQIVGLKKEIATGHGDASSLREQVRSLQDALVSRLAQSDARYAAERDAFVQAISALFDTKNEHILVLLHRYSEGDVAAIDELQRALRDPAAPQQQRLVSDRAFATLLLDAAQKKLIDDRKVVAVYEALLDQDPNDLTAMEKLYSIYLFSNPERARSLAERMHQRWVRFGNPTALADSLLSLAETNLLSGDLDHALRFAEEAVATARVAAAETYVDFKASYPTATEPKWMIDNFHQEHLASALRMLANVRQTRREYLNAAHAANEAASLRRMYINTRIAAGRPVGSVPYAYAESASSAAASIYADAGDWSAAVSTYRVSIDLANAASTERRREEKSQKPILKPFWVLIPFARASVQLGHLDEADRALTDAWSGLKAADPSPSVVGSEGFYWLQIGNLHQAKGQMAQAISAWKTAEAALAQAVSLDRDRDDWEQALKETRVLLSNG